MVSKPCLGIISVLPADRHLLAALSNARSNPLFLSKLRVRTRLGNNRSRTVGTIYRRLASSFAAIGILWRGDRYVGRRSGRRLVVWRQCLAGAERVGCRWSVDPRNWPFALPCSGMLSRSASKRVLGHPLRASSFPGLPDRLAAGHSDSPHAVVLTPLECRRRSSRDAAVFPAHDGSDGWRSLSDPLRYRKVCGRSLPGRASNSDILASTAIPVDRHCYRGCGCVDYTFENSSHARTGPALFVGLCFIGLRNGRVVRKWHRLSGVESQICAAELEAIQILCNTVRDLPSYEHSPAATKPDNF